jgi:ribosome-binding factor A
METSEYYKPTLVEEKPLPLEEKEIAYAKELLGLPDKSDGFIPLTLEQDVVVQRISHDLYAKPESGFRELLNNEIRACRTAEKIFGAKPKIVITLDPSTRDLEIRGTESTGMSIDTFKNVYTVVGRSSNFSGEEIGQFGFGRISYPALSDIMILETKYRTADGQTGEYAIMGKNGIGFNILPKPNLDSYGTVVKLVLKKEVNLHHLADYIREACAFSSIPTYLDLTSDLKETGVSWRIEEIRYPKGSIQLNKTFAQKAEEAASRSVYYHGKKKGGELVRSFHTTMEGVELYAEFRVGEKEYYDYFPHLLKIGKDERLIGSPIEIGIDLPFSYYVVNVLDERKFKPTADRERLREESVKELSEQISAKVYEEISSFLNVNTLKEYLSLDMGTAAIFLSERSSRDDEPTSVAHFLPERTKRLRSLLLHEVKIYKEKESSGRYNRRNLASVLARRNLEEIFFSPLGTKFNVNHIDRILQEIPAATFIQLVPSSRDAIQEVREAEEILQEEEIQSTGEYMRKNKDRLAECPRKIVQSSVHIFESITGYYSWGRFAKPARHIESVDVYQTLPKNVIRVPKGSLRKYSSLLSRVKTNYKLVQDDKGLHGGIKLEDFVSRIGEKVFFTSKGTMKLKELLLHSEGKNASNQKKSIHLYLYSDRELAKYFVDSNGMKIFEIEDHIFEIALFLTYHSIAFTLDTQMAELFDSEFDSQSRLRERSFSRRNFLHDYSWEKLGDSEILGSVMHVFKEIEDESMDFLFARAVQGSKDSSEVASMRRSLLARWKLMKKKSN